MNSTIIALIPARYGSSRLNGKPLLKFGNKTMIQRVYLQTIKSKLIDKVFVVTDDERVKQSVEEIGGNVLMVTKYCLNGTERIYYALKDNNLNASIVVNVQGDEPFINPEHIDIAINKYLDIVKSDEKCVCSTLCYKITKQDELNNPSIGKLVRDNSNYIMYCSRNCIPWNKTNKINSNCSYYGHIGLFVFKLDYLMNGYMSGNTTLQLEEDIEWMKILEQGYKILCTEVSDYEIGVNTPEDYKYLQNKYGA